MRVRVKALLALLLSAIAMPAMAEEFSSTNLQLLFGADFRDRYYGNNTAGGQMTTLTLEHFGVWSHGDNYFFIDLTSGEFVDFAGTATGSRSHIYAEWAPRLSLSKLTGRELTAGPVKDLFLAGQLNRDGLGFHAELIGLGIDISIPGFNVASLNGYLRKDNFNRATWQLTAVWSLPIGQSLFLDGYLDLNGTDTSGTELNSQPQILYNFGNIMAGVEWYLHRNRQMTSSVPQGMVKWVW